MPLSLDKLLSESRDCLFSNVASVEVRDDAGQLISSHLDCEELTCYVKIIKAFFGKG